MNLLQLDVVCSIEQYNNINRQIEIVDFVDIDKKNDYVVFTLSNCTIEQLTVLENELTDCSSLVNIVVNTTDLLLIETFVDDNDLQVDIDDDFEGRTIIRNEYIDSNMTFDVVRGLFSL